MNRTFLLITSLFVTGLYFSCSTTEPEIGNDSELIQLIKSSPNKRNINVEDLPYATRNLLERDFYEDLIEAAKIAPELGYEIDLMRCKGAGLGNKMQVYFNLDGRKLEERRGKGRGGDKGRGGSEECFEFVLPVTFTMPDGSNITVSEKEDWLLIREWYIANPDLREKPSIEYPVDIKWKDGTIKTISSDEEMRRVYAACDESRGKEECFEYVLPVTFIMPDDSIITVEEREGWMEIRNWYKSNPYVKERPSLQYPVDIIFIKDKTTWTLNSDEDLRRAYAACRGGG
jgi:hypothetical protein